jgi:membrane protease YdiL (CAAX protease family)
MGRLRAIALYFGLAFGITWGLQVPAVLALRGLMAGPPERYMALVGLGGFGPAAAAMIVAGLEGSGVRALLRPLGVWRVGLRWYLAALGLPGGIFVVAAAAYNLCGHREPLLYPPNEAAFLAALVVFSIGEEIGWRGFALPRLRAWCGPVATSGIIGVLWTAWHIPMLTLQGVSPILYVALVPFMIGGSLLFTWIYQRTRGSLLLAVLTHAGVHLNNPGHALPGRTTPILLHTAAYIALAVILLVADRRAWLTERAPHPTDAAPTTAVV